MKNVQVPGDGNYRISFKMILTSKCQNLFKLDKTQEKDSSKKLAEINSHSDPVIDNFFTHFYITNVI